MFDTKEMSNHEAAEILKLMPKQSEAIKKAIEVLEQTRWHTEPPTEEGEYLVKCKGCYFHETACYSKDLYKVDKFIFNDYKGKAGFYSYGEWGYYEVTDLIAWTYIPAYEGVRVNECNK